MVFTARLLMLLLTLLLAPQGLCLCQPSEAGCAGQGAPSAPSGSDEEHIPGCPAVVGEIDCLSARGPELPDPPALPGPAVLPATPLLGAHPALSPPVRPPFDGQPIYLTVRALLL